ncbi:MAG: hypothetical protein ACK4ND_04105 [Cytophagaceae bacterium]
MKSYFTILLLLITGSLSFGQLRAYDNLSVNFSSCFICNSPSPTLRVNSNQFQLNLLEKGRYPHPLEKTGKTLSIIGIPLLFLGTYMVANATSYSYQCVNGICQGDPLGGFGSVILVHGIGLTGAGVPLWIIGAGKSKKRNALIKDGI